MERLEEKNTVTTQQINQCNGVAVCRWKVETERVKIRGICERQSYVWQNKGRRRNWAIISDSNQRIDRLGNWKK